MFKRDLIRSDAPTIQVSWMSSPMGADVVTNLSDRLATRDSDFETPWTGTRIYTTGHSTRPQEEFIDLLRHYAIVTLVDVRKMPCSRCNPHFNSEELSATLALVSISYVHLALLGGLRRGLGAESPNMVWRNTSFRAYADYMQTPEFAEGMKELHGLFSAGPLAVMCAEAVPWRCHRGLIADALLVRGVETVDIQSLTQTVPHKLTPFARVEGERITYPPAPETGTELKDEDDGHESAEFPRSPSGDDRGVQPPSDRQDAATAADKPRGPLGR